MSNPPHRNGWDWVCLFALVIVGLGIAVAMVWGVESYWKG